MMMMMIPDFVVSYTPHSPLSPPCAKCGAATHERSCVDVGTHTIINGQRIGKTQRFHIECYEGKP